MRKSASWLEEIVAGLENLGGKGSLNEIYDVLVKRGNIELSNYKDWKSQIRKQIYLHSSDTEIFNSENDLFYAVYGKGKGIWGLKNYNNKIQTESFRKK